MKIYNLFVPVSLIIIGAVLTPVSSAYGTGKGKKFIVKLKGNTLYATPRNSAGNTSDKTPDEPKVVVIKKKKAKKHIAQTAPAVETAVVNKPEPAKVESAGVSKPESGTTETTAVNSRETVTTNTNLIEPSNQAVAATFDYEQRQVSIHTTIFQLYPGTYLDSMAIVNNLLSDSIRTVIAGLKNPDSIAYMKSCLESSLKDSITLVRLSALSSPDQQEAYVPTGVLIAHCKDASSSAFMDSVVMDVFSGSNLVASASSDKDGIILAKGVPQGNYYVVFTRKSYEPYSIMSVSVNGEGQSYIDIPLIKADSYVAKAFGKNAWLIITTGVLAILLLMVVLAYYLNKYTSRRSFAHRRHTHAGMTPA